MPVEPVLRTSDELLLCNACGTQFSEDEGSSKDECRICDDPRQFVPPEGQSFTTLAKLKQSGHRNSWRQDNVNPNIWIVQTTPKFAIGQRAILLRTPAGNVLWDLISLLDQETVDHIVSLGGLAAIVISHPHYYTTWADWSRTFACPVYVGEPDRLWLERRDDPGTQLSFLNKPQEAILSRFTGITAILAGGHFPGSLLLHWERTLFIADTIFTSRSSMNPMPGKPGVTSYSFFWSIPNYIPLHPNDVHRIWQQVKPFEFDTTMGAFEGQDVRTMGNEVDRHTGGVKGRLLESCKIYIGAMGWPNHAVHGESL